MKKKFCTFCGLSLLMSCGCGEKAVDKMKGLDEPESKYPTVNLMGLPPMEEVTEKVKEILERRGTPENVIMAGLQGPVRDASPPDDDALEAQEKARKFLLEEVDWEAVRKAIDADPALKEHADGETYYDRDPSDGGGHRTSEPYPLNDTSFRRPIPPEPIGAMVDVAGPRPQLDPDTELGEIHPRLLSVALLGKDVGGKDDEKAEEVRSEMAEFRRIEDEKAWARDKRHQEWAEICRAGRAVAQAIHAVPQDDAHPVVVENKVEALFDYMSVETATDDVPHEIRFAVPKEEFKEGINRAPSDFDVHRFVHLDSMPPELQEVIKSYLGVIRSSSGHRADLNMERFKESAMALAGSLIATKKKAV